MNKMIMQLLSHKIQQYTITLCFSGDWLKTINLFSTFSESANCVAAIYTHQFKKKCLTYSIRQFFFQSTHVFLISSVFCSLNNWRIFVNLQRPNLS
jgi:hypothetical protein